MLLFKDLKDCLFLLLTILIMVIKKLKETVVANYNALIDRRNFYDQPIRDQIKKCDEIRKIANRTRR